MDVKIKTNDLKFKFRVCGIIINDGKILLEEYSKDSFCLPGGYVNLGESSEDAIQRELKEELEIDFNIDSFLGVIENFFTNLRLVKTHGIEFYYKVSFKNVDDIKKIDYNRIENDHGFMVQHHFRWIDLNGLDNTNLVPNVIINKILCNEKDFHLIFKDFD